MSAMCLHAFHELLQLIFKYQFSWPSLSHDLTGLSRARERQQCHRPTSIWKTRTPPSLLFARASSALAHFLHVLATRRLGIAGDRLMISKCASSRFSRR
ncbi:hypothetical protein BaRGS_00010390 [Batillaria attramentaria]|uniref:Secreted protein n=1 Tax=Batillaria attramentaria TaxID=370345 RepID=A0ABD0LGU7_9CAEN